MAKIHENSLKNLVKYKKGQSGNPSGGKRKLISSTILALENAGIKETTANEVRGVYLRLLNLTINEIQALIADESSPALVRIVGKAMLSGKGLEIIELMLDRSIGKATAKMDITSNEESVILPPYFK